MESNSSNKAIIGIIVVVLLVVAATAVIVTSANNNQSTETANDAATSPSVSTSTRPATNTESSSSEYKNGTYSATGNYQTPGGRESIDVTVTLVEGAITDARVEQNATGGESVEYQGRFVSGFKSQVVGKKIDEVNLSRVAGSSLTPNGFNSAIRDIEDQAKA